MHKIKIIVSGDQLSRYQTSGHHDKIVIMVTFEFVVQSMNLHLADINYSSIFDSDTFPVIILLYLIIAFNCDSKFVAFSINATAANAV